MKIKKALKILLWIIFIALAFFGLYIIWLILGVATGPSIDFHPDFSE